MILWNLINKCWLYLPSQNQLIYDFQVFSNYIKYYILKNSLSAETFNVIQLKCTYDTLAQFYSIISRQYLQLEARQIKMNGTVIQLLFQIYDCIIISIAFKMGNDNSQALTSADLRNFPMHKYVGDGMNQQDIIKIKEAFDSYRPVDGRIRVSRLFETTEQSGSTEKIHSYLKGKNTLDFDEFFAFSKQLISEQKKNNPDFVLDVSEVQASCLFCPYTTDVPKNSA